MRLTEQERISICAAVKQHDPNCHVYLYGSRIHDDARGGDIDLLILTDQPTLHRKLEVLFSLEAMLGERRIDLLLAPFERDAQDPFVLAILPHAVRL